jgi:hypothetical protein
MKLHNYSLSLVAGPLYIGPNEILRQSEGPLRGGGPARTHGGLVVENSCSINKKANPFLSRLLNNLKSFVAGAGLEPATFGL